MAVTTAMPRPLSLAEASAVEVAEQGGYLTVHRGQRRAVAAWWRWCYGRSVPLIAVAERRKLATVLFTTAPAGRPLDRGTFDWVRRLVAEYRPTRCLLTFYGRVDGLPIADAHRLAERLAALMMWQQEEARRG